jgi:tetratricopeptide (TPR) repeat protein
VIPGLLLVLGLAHTPLQAYNQGNALFARKDYAGAIQAYEQALAAGPSAAVHYNLGNACFKAGQIGRAVVNYRRARALDPRDPDVAANLRFARSYRVDKVLADPGPFARALDDAFHRLSRREAAELAAVACLLAALLLALWIVRRRSLFAIAASLCGLVALFGVVTQQVWAGEIAARPAVVVVPEVNALSGPGPEFKQILLVHDGTEVRIREARGAYLLVQLPGGGGGWVPKDAVERIYP